MKITAALSTRAKLHGIIITRYTTETNLIRHIQLREKNSPCFRTDDREGCLATCEWASGCKNFLIAAWRR